MPQRSPHEDDVWSLKKGGTVPGNSGGEGHWLDVVRARPKDQPFFFWFASLDAHRDWDADRQWDAERYGPKHRPENVVVPPFLLDDSVTRQDLASYYNEITRFDYYVGQVIEELRRQEVLDDTVILILADNGRCFPRAKTRLHDPGMKSPLVIHWPNGLASNNVNCTQLISAIDLCPTILSLAEVAVPGSVQGISLGPVLTRNLEGGELARRYAFSEHNWHDYQAHGRAVRTADGFLYVRNARPEMGWLGPADSISSPSHVSLREKLKENAESLTAEQRDTFVEPRPSEELYFTPDDPHQIRNLIQDVRHASTLEELRGTMNRWQDETGDSVPEDLSPDYFDRLGGYLDSATGQRIQGERVLGTPPGADRRADWIDAAGPR